MTDIPTLMESAGVVIAAIPVGNIIFSAFKAMRHKKQGRELLRSGDKESAEGHFAAADTELMLGNLITPWMLAFLSLGIGLQVIGSAWVLLAWWVN